MKSIFILCFLLLSQALIAQKQYTSKLQKGNVFLDYHPVSMPNGEVDMGFSGVHLNLELKEHWYGGLGIYGSVHGERGGFFTLGFDLAYQNYLTKKIYYDLGFHFGGGGGASAPDGGGAFILPHVNLGLDLELMKLSAGYSYVNFFDHGNIESHQWNVGLSLPISFLHSDFNRRATFLTDSNKDYATWNHSATELEYKLHLNNLYNQRGNLVGKTIHLVGLEVLRHGKSISVFFKADGAYRGIKAGYMDILFGVGKKLDFLKNRMRLTPKLGIGGGGGGGLNTFGGLFFYGSTELSVRVSSALRLFGDVGILSTPGVDFLSTNYGFGLAYNVFQNGNYYPHSSRNFSQSSSFKGFEGALTQEYYYRAQRVTGKMVDMQQIGFQLNFYVHPSIYVGGQTSFANFGDAGAYAEGIAGIGYRTPNFFKDKMHGHIQVLGGAAGGGGISTGQGLIVKPSLGLNYHLNSSLSVKANGGYINALGGNLNTWFVNLGIGYELSLLFNHH
ncbi:hypothetical protein SAMN05216474_2845 [Lishizhenia tianjinensis]|uniref:Uncharacterized protein n=1 Tax=Lishizhenia tianjinensis TaxID=477690 RepID=A0A1I7BKN4_9FLAO|nr:hypothetical protein [Lishizhenia tianjinensis]SFT87722.1 hypothetical protein SAMN05216474_2845 [Lishizhenia tianjinensis]